MADDERGAGVLEALFIDERPRLLRLSRGLLGDPGDAEDAVQEAFARAAPRLHEALDPTAYLVVVTRNVCFEELRRRRLRSSGHPRAVAAAAADPEASAIERDALRRAWETISVEERAVLGHAIVGRSLSETADLLGTSVDAAAQRLSRARRRARFAASSPAALVGWLRLHLRLPRGAWVPRMQQVEAATAPLVVAVIAGTVPLTPAAVGATPTAQHAQAAAAGVHRDGSVLTAGRGGDPAGVAAHAATAGASGAGRSTTSPLTATHVSTGPGDPVTRSEATSFTASPAYASDHTVYASTSPTVSPCPTTTCASLLRSSDAGGTWTVAGQFGGGALLFPPGSRVSRIFAINSAGLEQSDDAGAGFRRVLPLAASPDFVPIAVIDPASTAADPLVVVTASPTSLVTYDTAGGRATADRVLPAATQKIDALLAAPGGGVYVDVETVGGGGMYVCPAGGTCSQVGPWIPGSPILSPTFSADHALFSALGNAVLVTHLDGSDTSTLRVADPVARLLPALDHASSGRLDALVVAQASDGSSRPQLLESVGGAAFQPSAAQPWVVPMDAATLTLLPDGELIAGLQAHTGGDGPYGIARSSDGGRTWSEGG